MATLRKARKEHRCTERSYHAIKPGDVYLSAAGPPWADWNSSGKWWVIKACLRCADEFGLHTSDTRKQLELPMNLREFSFKNRQRSESPEGFGHKLSDWSISDWFTATMGELGEAANVAKKLNRVRDGIAGNKETGAELQAKLALELADTFIYLDLLAQAAGIDLPAAVVLAFNAKSKQIGCPIRI